MTDACGPNIFVTEEERQIVDGFMGFLESEIMPIQRALGPMISDQRLYYLPDGKEAPEITEAKRATRMAAAKAGYYSMFNPVELGGAGLGIRLYFLCHYASARKYGAPLLTQMPFFALSSFSSGPHEVWLHASDALRAEVFAPIASGERHGAFGLTEPDAGSDAYGMKTTARRDGGDWIINGMKQWTSWSPTADYVIVYAITNKDLFNARAGGISCFYVPTDAPGFKVESVLRIFGHVGGNEGILSFTDVRIPDYYRIGEVDRGLSLALSGVQHGRMNHISRSLGLSDWALAKATDYAKIRKTFGKTISEHQTIQNYLAECAVKLYSGYAMAMDCATRLDRGDNVRGEVSMAKVYSTNVAYEIVDTCIQIHGGVGISNESHLWEGLEELRLMRIAEGTTEIQKRTVAKELLADRLSFYRDF